MCVCVGVQSAPDTVSCVASGSCECVSVCRAHLPKQHVFVPAHLRLYRYAERACYSNLCMFWFMCMCVGVKSLHFTVICVRSGSCAWVSVCKAHLPHWSVFVLVHVRERRYAERTCYSNMCLFWFMRMCVGMQGLRVTVTYVCSASCACLSVC